MFVTHNIKEEHRKIIKNELNKETNAYLKEKLLSISMYLNGITKEEIANIINKDRNTVGRWISCFFDEGIESLADNRGGNRKSLLNEEQKLELKNIIVNSMPIFEKCWSGALILDLIKERYEVKCSISSVYNILKELNITYKKGTKINPKKSYEKIDNWKEEVKKNLKI